jgi:hypothetical protein
MPGQYRGQWSGRIYSGHKEFESATDTYLATAAAAQLAVGHAHIPVEHIPTAAHERLAGHLVMLALFVEGRAVNCGRGE